MQSISVGGQSRFEGNVYPRSIHGWPLRQLINFGGPDQVLRFAMMASPLRRQAIFLVMALLSDSGIDVLAARFRSYVPSQLVVEGASRAVEWSLINLRVRAVIEALLGSVPEGILGVFKKIGYGALPSPADYLMLCRILNGELGPEPADALRQANVIGSETIAVVANLDRTVCLPGVVNNIRSAKLTWQINSVIKLSRTISGATDEAIRASVAQVGPEGWREWALRWAGKARCFNNVPPVRDDDEIVGLHTADALRDAARRFRNCLSNKIGAVAIGETYYLEYLAGPAIIELVSLSQGHWLLYSMRGPNNDPVDERMVPAIWAKLKPYGILLPTGRGQWNDAAELLLSVWERGPHFQVPEVMDQTSALENDI